MSDNKNDGHHISGFGAFLIIFTPLTIIFVSMVFASIMLK